MLHILNEGGNAELKNRFFPLGDNIRKHLQRTLNSYSGDKDVDGYKRLVNILSMENGIAYNEMKRIKNFFDNFKGSPKSIEFILNGGQPMMLWVNATLNRATQAVKDFKAAKKAAGVNNAYIKPHEKNRQTKTTGPTTAKIQTKNVTKNIDNNSSIKYENKSYKKSVITESQESKSISAAKKLVIDKMGWDEQRADKFVREELRGDIPTLRTKNGGKFILGVTRMFLDRQLTDGGIIQRLNATLELVASDAHINEYDRNLNGLSAEELINRFAGAMKEIGDKDREENAALELQENNDYTIVKIDSFEQSEKYGQYTSWCVTHNENMLDSYTSDGIGQFYFCLKNGFENVPRQIGEGCPLDEYGLSMVAVSVDGDGHLNTSTCRWNHDNGGNDHIMDTKQISQLIGRNFYDVFKPNNKWQTTLESVIQRLANGERPQEIFERTYSEGNGFIKVRLLKKYNICVYDNESKKYKLLFPDLWFDEIYYDELIKLFDVSKNKKWNWIKEDGTLLSPNLWFDNATDFIYGISQVCSNGKWNFFNVNGEFLCDTWYDDISKYSDNLARVELDGKFSFIDRNGKLAFNKWFTSAYHFSNGFSRVELGEHCNLIDTKGNFVSDQWFQFCDDFEEGFAIVALDRKFNYIDTNGNILSKQWFDKAFKFKNGFAIVSKEGKQNFIKTDGNLISDRWYDDVSSFENGFAVVEDDTDGTNNQYNYIDTNGKLLSDMWFYWCSDFENGIGYVQKLFNAEQNKYNMLKNFIKADGTLVSPNKWFTEIRRFNESLVRVGSYVNGEQLQNLLVIETGEILCDNWFDSISEFVKGFARVSKESLGYNFINTDGDIISDNWFYDASYFENGFARIWRKNYDSNYINTNGETLSPNLWFDETYNFDENGFGRVRYNNKYNLIDGNGKFVSDQGFSYIAPSGDLYVATSLDGKPVIFNPEDNTISPMKMKNRFEGKQRKTITITESQAFDLLLEAASLDDVYQKYYNQIPEEEFRQIVAADPTSGQDKMGKYSKWLLVLYTSGNLKLEDLYKATEYLTTFHRYKAKLDRKDIGQYKSLPDLYDAIEPYADNTQAASHKEEIRQIKQNAEKVYEDNEWLVIVPLTKEAAIEYGKGTQWCTAATTSNNMFKYYASEGKLYININKKTGRKYQFHFETRQFMDENDRHIDIEKDFKPTEGLYKFYFSNYGWRALYLCYDSVYEGYPDDAPALVRKNGQSNYVNQNGELISETWYDSRSDVFNYGLAKVQLLQTYNYIDEKGNLLSPDQWFDFAESFYLDNDQARIELKRKNNLINRDGQIVSPDLWFDWCSDSVMTPAALVRIDGKGYNYVTPEGQILCKQWFDTAYSFERPDNIVCAEVINNNKHNFINAKGELMSPHMWFDDIWDFYGGCAKVKVGESYNLMDAEGNLFSPNMWFSSIDRYKDNMAVVVMYDENSGRYLKNFFNAETKRIISDEWFVDVSDFWSSPDNQHAYVVRQNGQSANINKDGEIVQIFSS